MSSKLPNKLRKKIFLIKVNSSWFKKILLQKTFLKCIFFELLMNIVLPIHFIDYRGKNVR